MLFSVSQNFLLQRDQFLLHCKWYVISNRMMKTLNSTAPMLLLKTHGHSLQSIDFTWAEYRIGRCQSVTLPQASLWIQDIRSSRSIMSGIWNKRRCLAPDAFCGFICRNILPFAMASFCIGIGYTSIVRAYSWLVIGCRSVGLFHPSKLKRTHGLSGQSSDRSCGSGLTTRSLLLPAGSSCKSTCFSLKHAFVAGARAKSWNSRKNKSSRPREPLDTQPWVVK